MGTNGIRAKNINQSFQLSNRFDKFRGNLLREHKFPTLTRSFWKSSVSEIEFPDLNILGSSKNNRNSEFFMQ